MIQILFALLVSPSFAAETFPQNMPKLHGELDTTQVAELHKIHLEAVKVKMELTLSGFNPSSLALLQKFDALMADIYSYRGLVHRVEIAGSPDDQVSDITVYADGAIVSGKLLFHNDKYFMQIPSIDGKKQLELRGISVLPEVMEQYLESSKLIVRGFLHDGGKYLQVARIDDPVNHDGSGMNVYLNGVLERSPHFEARTKNLLYFAGPNNERYFMKMDSSFDVLAKNMGAETSILGKNLAGGISVKYMDFHQGPQEVLPCVEQLMARIQSNR